MTGILGALILVVRFNDLAAVTANLRAAHPKFDHSLFYRPIRHVKEDSAIEGVAALWADIDDFDDCFCSHNK